MYDETDEGEMGKDLENDIVPQVEKCKIVFSFSNSKNISLKRIKGLKYKSKL